jgi:hypothetical protein
VGDRIRSDARSIDAPPAVELDDQQRQTLGLGPCDARPTAAGVARGGARQRPRSPGPVPDHVGPSWSATQDRAGRARRRSASRLAGRPATVRRRAPRCWRLSTSLRRRSARLRNPQRPRRQGPMQFILSTWRAYGLVSDINDAHDAILGTANYLHANGAPTTSAVRPSTTTRRATTSVPSRVTPAASAPTGALYSRTTRGRSTWAIVGSPSRRRDL